MPKEPKQVPSPITCHVCKGLEILPTNSGKAHHRCNSCMKQIWKRHAKQNSNTKQRIKNELIEAYGNACQCCGEKDRLVLELDHIFGDGYKFKKNGRRGYTAKDQMWQLRKAGWPKDRMQLLCRNCNWAKHRLKNEWPVHREGVQYKMYSLAEYA